MHSLSVFSTMAPILPTADTSPNAISPATSNDGRPRQDTTHKDGHAER